MRFHIYFHHNEIKASTRFYDEEIEAKDKFEAYKKALDIATNFENISISRKTVVFRIVNAKVK